MFGIVIWYRSVHWGAHAPHLVRARSETEGYRVGSLPACRVAIDTFQTTACNLSPTAH